MKTVTRLAALSVIGAVSLLAQLPLPGGGVGGGVGVGAANVTATAAGPVTSLAITITSLNLTTIDTGLIQCWSGTSTRSPIAITNFTTTGSSPITTVTPTFSSSSNVTCVVNSNGGAGAAGATGATGQGFSDGDKGDIVISSSGSVLTIDSAVISSFARTLLDDTTAAAMRITLGLLIGGDVQAWSADLDAINALSSTGFAVRTALDTWAQRTITGTSNEITLSNGDGVSGNPTISLASALNLASKSLIIPSSTSLPGTCSVGQIYMDTDATSGQRLYACESSNTWVLQGGTGGGGTGLLTLNTLTADPQTFAFDETGTTPGVTSATSTHTFHHPLASAAGVTNGGITKAFYDTILTTVNYSTTLGGVYLGVGGVESTTAGARKSFLPSSTIAGIALGSASLASYIVHVGDLLMDLSGRVYTVDGTNVNTVPQFVGSGATPALPGAGLAHFAGSTDKFTSSAVSLTADVTGVLPTANIAVALANQTSLRGNAMAAAAGDATIGQVIAHGAKALDFASTATGACATVITDTATGALSTDTVIFNANASIKAVTGYVPAATGGFSIAAFPSTDLVSFEACNWTAGTVDPGSITVNWKVIR